MNVKYLCLPGPCQGYWSCLYELLWPEKMVFANNNLGTPKLSFPSMAQTVTRLLWGSGRRGGRAQLQLGTPGAKLTDETSSEEQRPRAHEPQTPPDHWVVTGVTTAATNLAEGMLNEHPRWAFAMGSQGETLWRVTRCPNQLCSHSNSCFQPNFGTFLRLHQLNCNYCRMSWNLGFVAFFSSQILVVLGLVRRRVLDKPPWEGKMSPVNDTDQKIASPRCKKMRLES